MIGNGGEEVLARRFRGHCVYPGQRIVRDEFKSSTRDEVRCHPQTKLAQFRVGTKREDRQRTIEAFSEVTLVDIRTA